MAVVVIVLTAWCGLCLAGWVDLVRRYRAARRAELRSIQAVHGTPPVTIPSPTPAAGSLDDLEPAAVLLATRAVGASLAVRAEQGLQGAIGGVGLVGPQRREQALPG